MKYFEGPELRLMFYKFDDPLNMRLNEGVRGRLIDRVKDLIKENKIDPYDVNEIYLNTKEMTPSEGRSRHDFNVLC